MSSEIKVSKRAFEEAVATLRLQQEILGKAIDNYITTSEEMSSKWRGDSSDAYNSLQRIIREALNTQNKSLGNFATSLLKTEESFANADRNLAGSYKLEEH